MDITGLKQFGRGLAAQLDKLARFSWLAVISVVVLGIIAIWFNPAKAGSYLWVISKVSLAALLGEAIWRAMTRQQGDIIDGLALSMAQTQRATLIAACIIAAGLMP